MYPFARWFLVSLLVPMIVACDGRKYRGDGDFVDYGSGEASWRYVLTLGEIYLDRKSSESFNLLGLPGGDYVLGLVIQENEFWALNKPVSAILKYRITDSKGSVAVQSQVPFDAWIWSVPADRQDAFVYVDGLESRFSALADVAYTLSIEVQPAVGSESTPLSGTLQLRSQGWK